MADHNATIAQLLPTITQSATGETDFFAATGTLTASERVGISYDVAIIDTVLFTESSLYIEVWAVSETATVDGTPDYASLTVAEGSLVVDGVVGSASWTTSLTSRRPLYVKARTSSSITISASSGLTLDDSVILGRTTAETEQLNVNGRITSDSGTFAEHVTDVLQVSGQLVTGQSEQVTSILVVDEATPTYTVIASEEASASFTVDDADTANVTQFQDLLSGLIVSDLITFDGSVLNNTVTDTLLVKDTYWSKDFGAIAWVLNPELGGVSSYTNFGFNSFAEHNGTLYATSPEGVFALTGSTDAGRYISAHVKTGFLDFNQDRTKRISDIFVGYTGGQLEFDVETYDSPQEVYTYVMEEREMDAPRNNRLKVGRGLSSRYWRFAIRNIDGADFQVYDVTAEVATSKRRL